MAKAEKKPQFSILRAFNRDHARRIALEKGWDKSEYRYIYSTDQLLGLKPHMITKHYLIDASMEHGFLQAQGWVL